MTSLLERVRRWLEGPRVPTNPPRLISDETASRLIAAHIIAATDRARYSR